MKNNISNPLIKDKLKTFDDFENEIEKIINYQNSEINKLKDMETYRKEFLGNVSHELKTPIFIAQSYIETLLDGSINDKKVNQKHLTKALKSIFRLSDIVKDLELISKLEKNVLTLTKQNFDIIPLVYDVVDSFELNAKTENVELIIDIPTDKKCFVYADEEKIEQVITNLIVNAIKYSKDEGIIKINCYDHNNSILIEIEDNGIGISKENLDRIFERFYRVDKDRSRKKGGTGLGLSIVKHILEAHNQKITVESTLNRGTKFSFSLDKAKH
ncbi:MAG: ATP-binding protein [Saprospiraceae bacterium]